MNVATQNLTFELLGHRFPISRPHSFGLVIDGPAIGMDAQCDYLHQVLLAPDNRETFLRLIDNEGLVVCKNLATSESTYRKVRGKSSHGKLSQAEYYHHDGCSCPTKPRVVEIRFPQQTIERNVHTAIAKFADVVKAQLVALPEHLRADPEIKSHIAAFTSEPGHFPPVESWDKIQGRVTRLVRREMTAETCRSYFRKVDLLADAYVLPWEMGESRLMVNNNVDLTVTMQHRRAFQKPKETNEQNGSLVKRWTAEEA